VTIYLKSEKQHVKRRILIDSTTISHTSVYFAHAWKDIIVLAWKNFPKYPINFTFAIPKQLKKSSAPQQVIKNLHYCPFKSDYGETGVGTGISGSDK
jgi:hypothetical protein